ncbi:hypothetical protein DAPPUDRAFT_324254 [Daphnia pulex]|uniref:Uncharacterized protein n=1 Tax=Daphnia pulex TaxID=6669 RepID=E9H149_DAPPU|nr:hypothetical protein DAPPUDRAFT_324254 [Daphnia pulex]|eukprot:EFX74571.1 hypothetical protein DAPPUDRAFT_324254 [Daphnia pulex]
MTLLVFVCATIFAWVWFLLVKNSESDTTTETRPEPNPKSCHNQVPTTNVQEATGRTHITPLPVMWKPEQASAVLPDSTESMDKNTEKSPVDHFPATTTRMTEEYVKNLENDNQNLKNEIGVCHDRFQNVSAMLHGVDEIVEEKERLQDEVKYLKETVAKYESDSRNQEKLDSDELTQLRDENSKLKTNLEQSDRTVSLQSDEMKNLMDTTNDLNNKLKETLLQYDELMGIDVASEVAEDESDSEKIQPQDGEKPDDNNELIKQLVDENSNLKTNLETSACMMSFQSEEIKNLTARTNELNNKLQRKALKNDELILKLATSRDRALTITDTFHEIESKLEKEINELKDQLNRKQKILEEKEVILNSTLQAKKVADEKVEEMHKSQLELKLAHQKNLVLTSLNDQLENELTDSKRTTEVIQAEFRRISEEKAAAFVFVEKVNKLAEESAQLADERQVANEKETENKELISRNSDLESDKSLLELNNDNLKKEAEDCREELERLKQENQKLLDTQEETLSSVQKSTKLAKEQVEALSEALAAMQEATKHTQNAAKATKTERESLKSGATKTKGEDKEKGSWIKKFITKRKAREYEDGYANLLETTGLQMVERAKILQDHANNIKAEGKLLKKKAKTLPK